MTTSIRLTNKLKQDLFDLIRNEPIFFGEFNAKTIALLKKVWDLKEMPSEDFRFGTAEDEIIQHMINNLDWNLEYLLIDRLGLYLSDEKFIRFLEELVHPDFLNEADTIVRYVLLFNQLLETEGVKFDMFTFTESDLPIYNIYKVEELDGEVSPAYLIPNKTPFIVVKEPSGFSGSRSSHIAPTFFPSFVLAFNSGWNDYGVKSEFALFYYDSEGSAHEIGYTKIVYEDEGNTSEFIDSSFQTLSNGFCSLGQSKDYYSNLKKLFDDKEFKSVLYALKDAAFFPEIHEKFERTGSFSVSLLRSDTAERLLRSARYEVYNIDESKLYSFKYDFKSSYSKEATEIKFNFSNEDDFASNRICAIIGKNGVGKTQLMTAIPMSMSKDEVKKFGSRIPIFSKVISVSFSVFDDFEIPKKTEQFNYRYCGLRNENGERMTDRAIVLRFHNTWKKIEEIQRTSKWRGILGNFIEDTILDEFIVPKEDSDRNNRFTVDLKGFNSAKKKFSSGQAIVLYIISEIVASIRLDSLILFDEPETHLHPNAITQLINTIYQLVSDFESYCIIATHSPLVVQNILAKNVDVLEKHEKLLSIRKIRLESFGENLSAISDEVFGNKDVPQQFISIIQKLVSDGKNYDEIVEILSNGFSPLNLNTRLLIKSLIKK